MPIHRLVTQTRISLRSNLVCSTRISKVGKCAAFQLWTYELRQLPLQKCLINMGSKPKLSLFVTLTRISLRSNLVCSTRNEKKKLFLLSVFFSYLLKNLINGRACLLIYRRMSEFWSISWSCASLRLVEVLQYYGIINQCPWHRKKRNNECVPTCWSHFMVWHVYGEAPTPPLFLFLMDYWRMEMNLISRLTTTLPIRIMILS